MEPDKENKQLPKEEEKTLDDLPQETIVIEEPHGLKIQMSSCIFTIDKLASLALQVRDELKKESETSKPKDSIPGVS